MFSLGVVSSVPHPLLEIHPEKQKTLCDFLLTQRSLGIAIVDILHLKKRGDRLLRPDNQGASISCLPWRRSRGLSKNSPMYRSPSKEFSSGPWTRLVKSSRRLFGK